MQIVNRAAGLFKVFTSGNNGSTKITTQPSRTYYKKKWTYDNKYTGKFDYHDIQKYPKRLGAYKEEELLDEVWKIRGTNLDKPSPFHVLTRVRGLGQKLHWSQRVTLRRLNLHSERNGDVSIVPNTPQFNEMIDKVKHLLVLKPAVFPDGRLPTEDDIGALRVCPMTGTVRIDEKARLMAKRLNLENPILFQGNFLRAKLAATEGPRRRGYLG